MNIGDVIKKIWNIGDGRDDMDATSAMREILRYEGDYVFESVDELRAAALEYTDLVEPEKTE